MTVAACALCPRRCGARREALHGAGLCGMGTLPVVARAALHFGEEPCISGTRGSGTVFFCGCPLGCVFCQNSEISRGGGLGEALSVEALGAVFAALRAQGAHNINLVTASHFAPAVAQTLRRFPPGIPVVYNSSGYESPDTLRLLDGLVDVYLPDFKYADAETARLCAAAPDYPEIALRAIAQMRRQSGPAVFDADGLLTRGTLVRHLVLPGLTGASMRALSALRDTLPPDVRVSLMGQYTPYGAAKQIKGLDRPLLPREYRRVAAHLRALGFDGYVQPPQATGTEMIPVWDRTGVEGMRGMP
ncbi:radical SAM family protein [Clostridia bacterium]|nr:radical SAM family protein [Clostridia bacterium]